MAGMDNDCASLHRLGVARRWHSLAPPATTRRATQRWVSGWSILPLHPWLPISLPSRHRRLRSSIGMSTTATVWRTSLATSRVFATRHCTRRVVPRHRRGRIGPGGAWEPSSCPLPKGCGGDTYLYALRERALPFSTRFETFAAAHLRRIRRPRGGSARHDDFTTVGLCRVYPRDHRNLWLPARAHCTRTRGRLRPQRGGRNACRTRPHVWRTRRARCLSLSHSEAETAWQGMDW